MCDTIVAHLIFTHLAKQTPQNPSELPTPLYICIVVGLTVIGAINSSVFACLFVIFNILFML